ncbi:MAG: hypothetical protein HZB42_14055 [Sphingobacteriales bacterium]|nr:hypothetical protein [Sphingobacteriales bacterium]
MKRLLLLLLTAGTIFLGGCLETTEEVTINEDGTGTYSTSSDMSNAISIAKNMGGGGIDKMPVQKMDSSISLGSLAEKMEGLTEPEKEMMKRGTMHIKMSMEDEKFVTSMNFSFTSPDEISQFRELSPKLTMEAAKLMMESLKTLMPGGMPMGGMQGGEMPEMSSVEDYYKVEFSNDKLEKKLNKDKYANVSSDQVLQGMKQAAEFGIPVSNTYIINLPRPAEKVEGRNVKLSEDKKKVMVTTSLDDFFDHPESLEFKVKF